MRFFQKKVIKGCEARGDGDSPYLTRFTIVECDWFQLCIHVFHRSDNDDLHDHPWPFVSLPIWRGYMEETVEAPRCPICRDKMKVASTNVNLYDIPASHYFCRGCHYGKLMPHTEERRIKRRKWPMMLLFRSATHRHRVELVKGKKAVTLVLMGKRVREWGLFTVNGWQHWKKYFIEKKC